MRFRNIPNKDVLTELVIVLLKQTAKDQSETHRFFEYIPSLFIDIRRREIRRNKISLNVLIVRQNITINSDEELN